MLQIGVYGVVGNDSYAFDDLELELRQPTDERLFGVAEALKKGWDVDRIHQLTKIDRWFITKIKNIVDTEARLRGPEAKRRPAEGPPHRGQETRLLGQADRHPDRFGKEHLVRARRERLRLRPVGQTDRHPGRRISGQDQLPLPDLPWNRGRRAVRPEKQKGDGPRLRLLQHRLVGRIRLVLRLGRPGPEKAGLRDADGQLQSRDRLDGLRYLRPALLRGAQLRAGPGYLPAGEPARHHPLDGRTDPQQHRPEVPQGRDADPRHIARIHRYGRKPVSNSPSSWTSSASTSPPGGSSGASPRPKRSPGKPAIRCSSGRPTS